MRRMGRNGVIGVQHLPQARALTAPAGTYPPNRRGKSTGSRPPSARDGRSSARPSRLGSTVHSSAPECWRDAGRARGEPRRRDSPASRGSRSPVVASRRQRRSTRAAAAGVAQRPPHFLHHVQRPPFRAHAAAFHAARLRAFGRVSRENGWQRGVDLAHSFGVWFADVLHTELRLAEVHADVRAVAILRQTSYPTTDESDRKSTRLNSSHLGISYAV